MKIEVNKEFLLSLLLTGAMITFTGCSKKADLIYPSDQDDIAVNEIYDEYFEESINNNEINEEQAINLVVTNIPDNAIISINGTANELNTYEQNDPNTYIIPSNDFTISFDVDGKNYSYPINGDNNSTIYISTGLTDNNQLQFNIEKNNNISVESLKNKLANYNINLADVTNDDDYNQDIVERYNATYDEEELVSERSVLCINNFILNEYNKNYDKEYYNSILRRGNGNNYIRIVDNETIKVSYQQTYVDDYNVIDNIENNVNYFFNRMNNTDNANYYIVGDIDLAHHIGENNEITEYIEKYYHGDLISERYSYKLNNDVIIEFGQVNYDNEIFLNDPYNLVNAKSINYDKVRINDNYISERNSKDSDYVHYYVDDFRTPTGGDYTHYYSDDYRTPSDGDYTHYYVDDYQTPTDDDYVHYYSDDDHSYYENYDNHEIYEYEEDYQYIYKN